MFKYTSKKSTLAASAVIALTAGLGAGTVSSASADPAPTLSGTYTTTTFTAPDQLASPANSIFVDSIFPEPRDTTWTDYSGWVNCQGGSWARLVMGPYPDPVKVWAQTELPASDSGKQCTMTIVSNKAGQRLFFPTSGRSLAYIYDGHARMTLKSQVVTGSRTGGL